MRRTCFAVLLTALAAVPSMACEIDTPTDWLPGFTEKEAEDRSYEVLQAGSHVREYLRIESNLKKASVVYLARVVKSDRQKSQIVYRTEVQPLKAFKGKLPAPKALIADSPSSCGFANGDGSIQFAHEGELVVVFEGLQKRKDQPRGIDSIRMIEVTYGSLLDPIQEWLQSQPGYGQTITEPRP